MALLGGEALVWAFDQDFHDWFEEQYVVVENYAYAGIYSSYGEDLTVHLNT